MKTVLVTGGSGYVGKNVVKMLCKEREYRVLSSGRKTPPQISEEICISNDVIFEDDDVLKDVDCVVNCAFSRSNIPTELAKGVDFTNRLFLRLKEARIENVINLSSQGVYLQPATKRDLNENDEIGPADTYGVAKYATELMIGDIFDDNDNFANIRLASVNMPQRFTASLIKSVMAGRDVCIKSEDQKVSLIDVADVAGGLSAMVKKCDKHWNHTYNLGSGEESTVGQLFDLIQSIAVDVYHKQKVRMFVECEAAKTFSKMDISAFKTDFDWQPKISTYEMILKMFVELEY